MKATLLKNIELPQKVSATLRRDTLIVQGPKGETAREFVHPGMEIEIKPEAIVLKVLQGNKKDKAVIGAYAAHIKNMVQGVQEPHLYKLKICSGHFPMSVGVAQGELVIKNFFGETVPRKVAIIKGVEVKVQGADILLSSPDIELAGQMASKIENLCRITNRDIRIFQDGCYITMKAGESFIA